MAVYTTGDEIRYIQGIGAHRKPPGYVRAPAEYIEWLQQYQAAIPVRTDWGPLNVAEITTFVEEELRRVQQGGAVPPSPREVDERD